MLTNRPARRRRIGLRRALLTAVLVGALATAACSTASVGNGTNATSSPSNADVAYALKQIDAAEAVPKFTLHAPAFDMSKIKGKLIFDIPTSSEVPYVVEVDQQAQKIAQQYGAKWIEYANQGTPTEWAAGINEAISDHANLIILAQTIDASELVGPLTRAKAAGIPVLSTHNNQIGVPLAPQVKNLVTAVQDLNFYYAARLSADYAIYHTGADLHALIIATPGQIQSTGMAAAIANEISTHCSGCTSTTVNVPIVDWGSQLTPTVESSLQSNPKINFILPLWDSMAPYINAAIAATEKTGQVGQSGFGGTTSILKMVEDGTVTADVGLGVAWEAYATMDQAGRILTGLKPIQDGNEQTGIRLFDSSNINQAGTPPVAGEGFGDSYVAGYTKLWSGK